MKCKDYQLPYVIPKKCHTNYKNENIKQHVMLVKYAHHFLYSNNNVNCENG